MLNPRELVRLVTALEKNIVSQKQTDFNTKRQISILFRDLKECAAYRIPMKPIMLDNKGHSFKCPKCGTVFDSPENTIDEYDLCYVCGQLWKDADTIMEEIYGKKYGCFVGNIERNDKSIKRKTKNGYGRNKNKKKNKKK